MDAYGIVQTARRVSRPTALDFVSHLFDDFIELHGDRLYGDDKAIAAGIARLSGRPVTVIGIQKGNTFDENIKRNFGQVNPEGYRKALRLMKQAEKFGRPVITLVNTAGAFCGVEAEERGQGEAIARNLFEMSGIRTPIISIIIGEGGSGGALALAVADRVWILKNAFYSILSPEGFASILWKDGTKSREAAGVMRLTAADLLALGVADRIIDEPESGLENDFYGVAAEMKNFLISEINELAGKDAETLLDERYKRFRKYGLFAE